jgi:hypothetical protein
MCILLNQSLGSPILNCVPDQSELPLHTSSTQSAREQASATNITRDDDDQPWQLPVVQFEAATLAATFITLPSSAPRPRKVLVRPRRTAAVTDSSQEYPTPPLSASSIQDSLPSVNLTQSGHRRSRSQHLLEIPAATALSFVDGSRRRSRSFQGTSGEAGSSHLSSLKPHSDNRSQPQLWDTSSTHQGFVKIHLSSPVLPNEGLDQSTGISVPPHSYSSLSARHDAPSDSGKTEARPPRRNITNNISSELDRSGNEAASPTIPDQHLSVLSTMALPASSRSSVHVNSIQRISVSGSTDKRVSYAHHRNTRILDALTFQIPVANNNE